MVGGFTNKAAFSSFTITLYIPSLFQSANVNGRHTPLDLRLVLVNVAGRITYAFHNCRHSW